MGLFRLCHICCLIGFAIVLIIFFTSINRTNTPSDHKHHQHTKHHESNNLSNHMLIIRSNNQSNNISNDQSIYVSNNPSHNQTTNRPYNQPDTPTNSQPFHQPESPTTNRPSGKVSNRSSNQSTNQSNNQSNTVVRQSFKKVHKHALKHAPSLHQAMNHTINQPTNKSTVESSNQPIQLSNFHQSIRNLNNLLSLQEYCSNRMFSGRSLLIDTAQFHSVFNQSGDDQPDVQSDEQSDSQSNKQSDKQPSKQGNQFLVPLHDSYHVMYTSTLHVGTPDQLIDAVLDTGSSCLWVVSADLEIDQSIKQSDDDSHDRSNERSKDEARNKAYHSSKQSNKQSNIPSYLQYYDHSLSSSYQPIDQPKDEPWSIQYGVGECSGYLSKDTVRLSLSSNDQSADESDMQSINQPINQLTVRNQTFAEATHLSSNFFNRHQSISGIVGLSFRGGSCKDWPTFVDGLSDQSVIENKMFSFQLSPEYEQLIDQSKQPIKQSMNQVIFGAPDSSLHRGDLTWVPVLHAPNKPPAMWFVRLDEMRMSIKQSNEQTIQDDQTDEENDQSINQSNDHHHRTKNDRLIQRKLSQLFSSDDDRAMFHSGVASFCSSDPLNPSSDQARPCIALPDSGTSFLTLPPKLFVALVSLLTHGRDDCMVDGDANVFCLNGPEGLPMLEFTFSGSLNPTSDAHSVQQTYVLSPYDYMLPNQQLAIQVLDFGVSDLNILILGDVFLRSVYTVFDADNEQIGFGQSIHSNSTYQSSREIYEHDIVVSQRLALLLLGALMLIFICCTCCLCYFIVNGCSFRWRRREYEPIGHSYG